MWNELFVKWTFCEMNFLWNELFVKWTFCEMIFLWNELLWNDLNEMFLWNELFVKWTFVKWYFCEMNFCKMMRPGSLSVRFRQMWSRLPIAIPVCYTFSTVRNQTLCIHSKYRVLCTSDWVLWFHTNLHINTMAEKKWWIEWQSLAVIGKKDITFELSKLTRL